MIKLSVCIPAYNRKEFLEPLLDSILVQDFENLEIIICEDKSPQREEIKNIVHFYVIKNKINKNKIKYFENQNNLGYDGNFKELLNKASGDFCLFMGNDDLLANGAIQRILDVVDNNPNVAVISRAYQWFLNDSNNVQDIIRHLPEDKLFPPGLEATRFFFRRVGVLSGLVFSRQKALNVETNRFDGHLFYQMYLAGTLVQSNSAYYISSIQTLSRDGIKPDFGNAEIEKDKFKPGIYLYKGRIHMVKGLLDIINYIDTTEDKKTYKAVKNDIAIYFYPYIRDQLNLNIKDYFLMIREFMRLGMSNEPFFYFHCIFGYIFKYKKYDYVIKITRKLVGHTPRLF